MSVSPDSGTGSVLGRSRSSAGASGHTMMQILEALLLKNRTIVSTEAEQCMRFLAEELPMELHRYPSGQEYGTWVIPPRWDVRKAVLSDGERDLASWKDHPLFVAPYSKGFTGWVTREELLRHVRSSPGVPDGFLYEYRLACDFRKRLTDWAIALPHAQVETLNRPKYWVDIQVDTGPGEMVIGESTHRGRSQTTFALMAHLCHTGQANDGLAGVVVGLEALRRIRREFPRPRLTYQLLVWPETFGSAVYLAEQESRIDSYLGALFLEMAGIQNPLRFAHTARGDAYLDRVVEEALVRRGVKFSTCGFLESWGNDERIFDSPGVGIPAGSLERYPFRWYHTSRDDLAATDPAALEEMVEVLVETARILESDFIPKPRQRVPVYLTRFGLYADWEQQREDYEIRARILELFWKGWSIFDISRQLGLSYDRVRAFAGSFVEHHLVEEQAVTPEYARKSWARIHADA